MMAPVSVPIIDHENPFYCPDHRQFRSVEASDANANTNCTITSSLSRKTTTTLASDHENVKGDCYLDAERNNRIYALTRGRSRVMKRPTRRRFAKVSHDSSPCARFPPSLSGKRQTRKQARYANRSMELRIPPIPGSGPQEQYKIKQESSSPILLASPDRLEQSHLAADGHENTPAPSAASSPSRECDIENIVTTHTLLLRLDDVFPRKGFAEAADSIEHLWPQMNLNENSRCESQQTLVDMLGRKGALNEYALTAIRDAEFTCLDIGPTLRGVNELGLPRGDIMRAFTRPGWFNKLRTLSFAGGRFGEDLALSHIRSLSHIETLILENTGIGNEGVFHVVGLKHTLRHLDLSGNPLINDDSIPALVLFEKLQCLSLLRTGVEMPGLRKLAVAVKEGERALDVKIPCVCRNYIDGMDKKYLLHPVPPLVSDSGAVSTLSKTALSQNLRAHATINPTIVSTGPRDEMEERLRRILEVRSLDVAVREMLVGQEEDRWFILRQILL